MYIQNPYRDSLTGPGYLEVYGRIQDYAKNYDNDERDRNREIDQVDIHDSTGDPQVGQDLIYKADRKLQTYSIQRSNGSAPNYHKLMRLSFLEKNGKVEVSQFTDLNGDGFSEVNRQTIVDARTGRIEKVTES